jgi:hypothetical protein
MQRDRLGHDGPGEQWASHAQPEPIWILSSSSILGVTAPADDPKQKRVHGMAALASGARLGLLDVFVARIRRLSVREEIGQRLLEKGVGRIGHGCPRLRHNICMREEAHPAQASRQIGDLHTGFQAARRRPKMVKTGKDGLVDLHPRVNTAVLPKGALMAPEVAKVEQNPLLEEEEHVLSLEHLRTFLFYSNTFNSLSRAACCESTFPCHYLLPIRTASFFLSLKDLSLGGKAP